MCNKYFDDGGLSLTLFVELMFSPIITFSLLRDTRMEGIWASWLIICSVLFAYCIVLHCPDIAVATLFYLLASALLYFDSQLRLKKTTDLVHRLQDTLAENERLAVEAQAVELRAMIGNIAHDLKSVRISQCAGSALHYRISFCFSYWRVTQPLTSFLSGVECMLEVVTSWENLLLNGNHAQFMAKAGANLHAIKKCIHSMSGTNSFMTMTINRCLDYTKASKGFHLVPKQETVTLKSVLEMPIRMLRDMQQKIEIRVRPWNDTICSHIITDKQWLLENLLCLLSNAVKYSNSGHVEVGVYLRDARNQEVTGRDMQVSRRRDSPHAEVTQDPELMLLFEVQDAGIGLSDEAMQTLFNPFKQAQRLAGGTGLGLFSLAKRVEALHGHYGVSRRPDGAQGSLFWFSIPYRPDEMTAAMGRSTNGFTPSPASSDSSHGVFLHLPDIPDATLVADPFALSAPCKYQILVVDDAPLIVRMTTMLLSRKGHTVTHAVNGAEALDRILAGYADEKSDAEVSKSIIYLEFTHLTNQVTCVVIARCATLRRGGDGLADADHGRDGGAEETARRRVRHAAGRVHRRDLLDQRRHRCVGAGAAQHLHRCVMFSASKTAPATLCQQRQASRLRLRRVRASGFRRS
jgi:signal transduction histidine kinase